MRLGDLDALKKTFENACIYGLPMNELYGAILKIIDNAPTVDISKEVWNKSNELLNKRLSYLGRPQGEWNYIQAGICVCPFCGATPHKQYKNFCPKCGAEMKGGAENG